MAEQAHQPHFIDCPSVRPRDSWIGHHDRQSLSPGNGNIDTVPVEDETQASTTEFTGTGTERYDDNGRLLSLKLVHGTNSRSFWQAIAELADLHVVGGHEQNVVHGDWADTVVCDQ